MVARPELRDRTDLRQPGGLRADGEILGFADRPRGRGAFVGGVGSGVSFQRGRILVVAPVCRCSVEPVVRALACVASGSCVASGPAGRRGVVLRLVIHATCPPPPDVAASRYGVGAARVNDNVDTYRGGRGCLGFATASRRAWGRGWCGDATTAELGICGRRVGYVEQDEVQNPPSLEHQTSDFSFSPGHRDRTPRIERRMRNSLVKCNDREIFSGFCRRSLVAAVGAGYGFPAS
jgi:hypothetical protein